MPACCEIIVTENKPTMKINWNIKPICAINLHLGANIKKWCKKNNNKTGAGYFSRSARKSPTIRQTNMLKFSEMLTR